MSIKETQNNLKVETISCQSLGDDDQNDQEGQNNEGSNDQDSQDMNNNKNQISNQNQDESNIKFSCKCGKSYSRNASLFNHIRIKHENKIHEWKIFEGMRKQGRPKKDQQTGPQGPNGIPGQEQMDINVLKLQSKKDMSHEMISSKNKDDIGQKLSFEKRLYQQMQAAANPFPFYLQQLYNPASHYYPDKFMFAEQQQAQQLRQYTQFMMSLQEEKPRHSLSMDIIIKFKDILVDATDEPLTEKEEMEHLKKLFDYQTSLFQKYKIDYDAFRGQFESLYTFLRYWMKFIKREKIDDTLKEYITFQFAKILKVNIEQSAVMERLQKIYEDFEKKSKGNALQNGQQKQSQQPSAAQINQSTTAGSNAAQGNNPTSSQQPSSPSESQELAQNGFSNNPGYPPHLYPSYPKFYTPTHYPPFPNLQPPFMNHLNFPIPPEGMYPPGLQYHHGGENEHNSHLYGKQAYSYPIRTPLPPIPHPAYLDGAGLSFPKGPNSSGTSSKGGSFPSNLQIIDKKHTADASKESK